MPDPQGRAAFTFDGRRVVARPGQSVAAARLLLSTARGRPCLLRFAEYFRDRSAEMVRPVAECVDRTLALDPGDAEALAAAS